MYEYVWYDVQYVPWESEWVSEYRVKHCKCGVELAGVRVPFRLLYERLKPSLLMDSIAFSVVPCQSQRSVSRPSFIIMHLCTWNACQSDAFRTCHTCEQRMSTSRSICSTIVQVKLTRANSRNAYVNNCEIRRRLLKFPDHLIVIGAGRRHSFLFHLTRKNISPLGGQRQRMVWKYEFSLAFYSYMCGNLFNNIENTVGVLLIPNTEHLG